jgi:hypothetical protein
MNNIQSNPPIAARGNRINTQNFDPLVVKPGDNWPEIQLKGRTPAVINTALIILPTFGTSFRLQTQLEQLANVKWIRQLWFYGINAFTKGIPTSNAGNVYVGYDKSFQPDVVAPWGSTQGYGLLYQPPDDFVVDFSLIYAQTTVNADGLFLVMLGD